MITIKGPRSSRDTNISAMRMHELAIQYWLNKVFHVQDGYPVPVIFAPVMDAYSQFQNLWKAPNNPFAYLLELKDECGAPLYEPYPANVRYPLMSVQRKDWSFRSGQNYTLHPARIYGWKTDKENPERNDLAYVVQRQRPMAWDFKYQIDFLCLRPDTQADFVERLMGEFWRSGGPEPQTWIEVPYPDWFGTRYIRVRLVSGQAINMTQEAPQPGAIVEFRTSITVIVEGYKLDSEFDTVPALWKLRINSVDPMNPTDLAWIFGGGVYDLRNVEENPILATRSPLPEKGPVLVIPRYTVAYDDFSSYTTGQARTLNAGLFLGQGTVADYGSVTSAIVLHGDSQALSLASASLIRQLRLGVFTKARVAILFTIGTDEAVAGSILGLGLVDSSGSSIGTAPKLFAGVLVGDFTSSQNLTYLNDVEPPVFVADGSIPYQGFLAWNLTQSSGQTATAERPHFASASGLYRRSVLVVDVEIVNPYTFNIQSWFIGLDQARRNFTEAEFVALIQQPDALSLGGISLTNGGSVSISSGSQYGTLDAVNIFWTEATGTVPLLLHAVAAVKLS